jgi:hypothetical protein
MMMVMVMMMVVVTNDHHDLRLRHDRCSAAEHEGKSEQNPFHG